MELALNEVKIQAKKLLKAIKLDSNLLATIKPSLKKSDLASSEEIQLKHCLTIVSQQLGFENWYHAQTVLSGGNINNNNQRMGTLFYPKGADGFINEWFADYQQAKIALSNQTDERWLLPYQSQFIVVKKDYILSFELDEESMRLWADINYNLVDIYNSDLWDKLTCGIIKNRPKNY